MADNLTVFNTDYTGVTGIKAKGTGNGMLTYIRPRGTKTITENGANIDVAKYAAAQVDVTPNLQSKIATPTTSQQIILADNSYDGLSSVTVNAIPSTYVGSGVTQRSSTDLTASGATVTVPAGYYAAQASKAVASGTAGTPTATKGTVSNHSVSVTPSVTNTTGYITGDTKTGTAVTVSASELVSGSQTITDNGTVDVTNYASVKVNIPVGLSKTDLRNYLQGSDDFTDIDWPDNVTSIHNGAFWGCAYFNPSSLPSGVTRIGERAFSDCSSLAITSLPNSITTIDPYAFFNCSGLALTSLSNSITTIGTGAFRDCSSLALTSLPNSITTIGAGAFRDCSSLALTSLPNELTSISEYAFYGCSNLALTSLPSGVTEIGVYAFDHCQKLALVNIPNNITTIGAGAFRYCHSLTITRLPSSLKSIGAYAFLGCDNLTTLFCEGAITMLGSNAFIGDSTHPMALTQVIFPNMKLPALGAVFGNTTAANACQLLEVCDIGSINIIGTDDFANCYKLQKLVLRKTASICTLSNVSAFLNTPMRGYNGKTGKVYVPSALIKSYKTANNWKTLYDAGTVTFVAIEGSEYER